MLARRGTRNAHGRSGAGDERAERAVARARPRAPGAAAGAATAAAACRSLASAGPSGVGSPRAAPLSSASGTRGSAQPRTERGLAQPVALARTRGGRQPAVGDARTPSAKPPARQHRASASRRGRARARCRRAAGTARRRRARRRRSAQLVARHAQAPQRVAGDQRGGRVGAAAGHARRRPGCPCGCAAARRASTPARLGERSAARHREVRLVERDGVDARHLAARPSTVSETPRPRPARRRPRRRARRRGRRWRAVVAVGPGGADGQREVDLAGHPHGHGALGRAPSSRRRLYGCAGRRRAGRCGDRGELVHAERLAARPRVDAGRAQRRLGGGRASRPSRPAPPAASCAAARTRRRRRRTPRLAARRRPAARAGRARPGRSRRSAPARTPCRPTVPARRTSAYQRALTDGTP